MARLGGGLAQALAHLGDMARLRRQGTPQTLEFVYDETRRNLLQSHWSDARQCRGICVDQTDPRCRSATRGGRRGPGVSGVSWQWTSSYLSQIQALAFLLAYVPPTGA